MSFKDKKVKVILSEEATKDYEELNKLVGDEIARGVKSSTNQSIFRSISRVKEWLKDNPFAGDQVKKDQIPKELVEKYDLKNLWRIELSDFWRLIYAIKGEEVEIICLILKICDHKDYNKIFGYDN